MPAWITPTQKPTGTKITAAIWDQDVVFNPQALKGQLGVVVIEDSIQIPDAKYVGRSANASISFDSTLTAIQATGSMSLAIDSDADTSNQAFLWFKDAPASNGTELMRLTEAGVLLLNDTANTNMLKGLTVNQGNADSEETIALKCTAVAHGVTDFAETDTFAYFGTVGGALGGLYAFGASSNITGFQLDSVVDSTVSTKATNSSGPIVLNAGLKSGTTMGALAADNNLVVIRNDGTTKFIFDADGEFYTLGGGLWVNDTANASMTLGLTINQGGADNEILALKSSDVAHGITGQTETDTYGALQKTNPTGGLTLVGLAGATIGFEVLAYHTTDDTTKSTAASGVIVLSASLKNGVAGDVCGANANLLVIQNQADAKFIFDAEGDAHNDGTGWTAYDDYDDVALLNALDCSLDKRLRAESAAWLAENEAALESARIVSFNRDTDGRPFINQTKLSQLLVGAIRQIGRRVETLEQRTV